MFQFLRIGYIRIFLYLFQGKNSTPSIDAPSYSQGSLFVQFEPTLHENASTQGSALLVVWFLRRALLWGFLYKSLMVFIKKFKKNANKLLIIQNCLPFKESVALYLNKLESCSPNIHALCQVWLIFIWLRQFWRRGRKCEKLTTTTDKF